MIGLARKREQNRASAAPNVGIDDQVPESLNEHEQRAPGDIGRVHAATLTPVLKADRHEHDNVEQHLRDGHEPHGKGWWRALLLGRSCAARP